MIEYATVPTHGLPLGGEILQQMGRDGWQLVTIEHGIAYFSREAQPETVFDAKAVINPANYSVSELQALELRREEWAAVLTAEKAGKNRATAVKFIEAQL